MKIFPLLSSFVLLSGFFSVFSLSPVYASWGTCTIKDAMSEELSSYIQTTEKLLSKIIDEASEKQCDTSGNDADSASASLNKTTSAFVGTMNAGIGFSNFATSGRFYIGIALSTEIPASIPRDHAQLGREIERIKNTIELVHNRCVEDVVPSSNLSDDSVYDTSGKTLGAILTEVLRNQVDMMNFYRETVLGDEVSDKYSFILVEDSKDFQSKLRENYGPKAFEACNKEADFFKDIKEAFSRIVMLGWGIEKGMKEWERAWKLLNSNSSDQEYAETERNVLRDELSHQGMSTKGSQVIMNNLAKYNSQNSNEGLSGFVSSVGDRIYASAGQFEKVYDEIKALLKKPQTTDQYMETTQILATLKTEINDEIRKEYLYAKDLIWPENMSVDKTVAKLIDTHILLESTKRFIQPYIKISEQTCDAQSTGEGNCRYR